MKLYLPHNAGCVDLGIDVDLSQSSEADRAFVAGLLRVTAEMLSPTPVVESTPIISPAEGQAFEDRDPDRCRARDQWDNRCIHDAGHIGYHHAAFGTTQGWSTEPPREETHERHRNVVLPGVLQEVRDETDNDRGDGPRSDPRGEEAPEHVSQRSGEASAPPATSVAEADVRATPTMTPEETMIWEAEQKAVPVVTKPKADHSKLWTPEMREAAAERARNRRKAAPFGLRVGEAEPPPLPKAFSLKGPEPQEAPPLATAAPSLPEEQAPPAAMPPAGDLAPEPPAHRTPFEDRARRPEPSSEPLPLCSCPSAWWTAWQKTQIEDLKPSSKHNHVCPLHRHRHIFPTATDAEGALVGRCECGHTETRYPYGAEDNLGPTAKAAKHRANIAIAPREATRVEG